MCSNFESIHTFEVHRTNYEGDRVVDNYQIGYPMIVALYAMSYFKDEEGYHTHKVTAIKYLRHEMCINLREAKYIVELIWEKFAVDSTGYVAYREEPFYVTYKGVEGGTKDLGPFVSE
jgi:hypothetical protein